jgi:hypothetical protein
VGLGLVVASSSLPPALVGCSAVTAGATGGLDGSGASGGGSSSGGLSADAASACSPSDVSTYVPGAYAPAVTPSEVCLGADGAGLWDAYYDACLGTAKSRASCDAFTAANPGCAACILTSYSSSRLGPIIDYGDFVGGNVAGCIEVETPGDLPCAKAVQALTDCEIAACQANCPVSDAASLMTRESCGNDADDAGCKMLAAAADSCRLGEADAGRDTVCMMSEFRTFFDQVVPLFCGRLPGSGADAGAEGDAGAVFAGGEAGLETDGAFETDASPPGPPDLAVDAAAE